MTRENTKQTLGDKQRKSQKNICNSMGVYLLCSSLAFYDKGKILKAKGHKVMDKQQGVVPCLGKLICIKYRQLYVV